ncbi:MAG TPA: hypothetical protein VH912_06320 [Streptosporangiaceae bacterium]|jgi:hypothetical protein
MNVDEAYKQEVLEPARAAGDQPPEDLRVRYRLREPLRPAEVAGSVKEVRQVWRRARGQLKYRKLIDRLEAEHRALVPVFDAAAGGDLGPLQARLRAAQANTTRRRVEAKARLLDAAGALGLLAPADIDSLARAGGLAVTELAELAAASGVEIRDPDPLPTVPPYQAFQRVREALHVLGNRHVPDFVLGARLTGSMRVLGGFQAPGVRLDRDEVEAVAQRWARHARDSSATNADTVLVALKVAVKQEKLDELVLYDIADRLRERQRMRASERALLRYATADLGLDENDAQRLVFAIEREEGGRAGGPAGRLRELIDAGEVHAAALVAEALLAETAPGNLDRDATILGAEARQRVAEGVRLRSAAAATPDPDRAWDLLAEALQLVPDLPGAEEHRRRLPPRPVPAAQATVDGTAVQLTWPASPSTAGDIDYQVVRAGPGGSGTEIAVTADLAVRDERPPVNVPLTYAVVAQRGDAAAPPVIAGPVLVRPEPSDVELFAGDGVVTGRWRCPPEAARTLVTRGDVPVPADRESFRDHAVRNGGTYHYRLTAVYLDRDGAEVTTPGVWRSATPAAPPSPIPDLTVEPDPGDPGRVVATFAAPSSGTAEVVVLGAAPPWPYGSIVPMAEVLRTGRRLAAVPITATPPREGLRFQAPTGVLLAVTIAGDTAAIGAHRRHVNLPPPTGLVAERRGEVIMVGFDWPPGVAEVEAAYQVNGDGPRRLTVTRAAYDAQGGLRLGVPESAAVEVAVCSIGLTGGSRLSGAPVTTTVPGRCLVRYDLYRTGPPWRRGLVLSLSPDQSVRLRRLTLVRSAGKVIPQRPGDGEPVAAWDDLDLTGPTDLEVSIPKPRSGQTGPYWLRCFLDSGAEAELADPPVRRLRFQ